MPLALHFDPYAGISAASALGALLDAGLALERLRDELAKLALDGWTITAEKATAGCHRHARHDHDHRAGRAVDPRACARTPCRQQPFGRRFGRRAYVRFSTSPPSTGFGTPRDDDPAGTLDTILAVIGVIAGLELLDVTEISTTAPPRGIAGVRLPPQQPPYWRRSRPNVRHRCACGRLATASVRQIRRGHTQRRCASGWARPSAARRTGKRRSRPQRRTMA